MHWPVGKLGVHCPRIATWGGACLGLLLMTACTGSQPQPSGAVRPATAEPVVASGDTQPRDTSQEPKNSEPLVPETPAKAATADGSSPPSMAKLQEANRLYASYFQIGDYDAARVHALQALHLSERQFGSDHPTTAGLMANVGSVYQRLGRLAEAEALLKYALGYLASHLGERHAATLNARNSLAAVLVEQRKLEDAERLLSGVLSAGGELRHGDVGILAAAINNLAAIQEERGNYAEAVRLYRRALPLAEAVYGPSHNVSNELRQRIRSSEERLAGQPASSQLLAATTPPARSRVKAAVRANTASVPGETSAAAAIVTEPASEDQVKETPNAAHAQTDRTMDDATPSVVRAAPATPDAVTASEVEQPLPMEAMPLSDETVVASPASESRRPAQAALASSTNSLEPTSREPTSAATPQPASAMERAVRAYHDKRYEEALGLWRELAEKGSGRAKRHLGGMYMDGSGVEQSYVRAYVWLTRSSQDGDRIAGQLLDELTARMTALQIDVAKDLIARSK